MLGPKIITLRTCATFLVPLLNPPSRVRPLQATGAMGLDMAVTGTLVASNLTSAEEHLAIHQDAVQMMGALKVAVEQTYTDIDSAWLVICGENGALGFVVPRAC